VINTSGNQRRDRIDNERYKTMPLSTSEAAKRLGISQMGVGHAIRRGKLKATRLGAMQWMITEEEVELYLRYHSKTPLGSR